MRPIFAEKPGSGLSIWITPETSVSQPALSWPFSNPLRLDYPIEAGSNGGGQANGLSAGLGFESGPWLLEVQYGFGMMNVESVTYGANQLAMPLSRKLSDTEIRGLTGVELIESITGDSHSLHLLLGGQQNYETLSSEGSVIGLGTDRLTAGVTLRDRSQLSFDSYLLGLRYNWKISESFGVHIEGLALSGRGIWVQDRAFLFTDSADFRSERGKSNITGWSAEFGSQWAMTEDLHLVLNIGTVRHNRQVTDLVILQGSLTGFSDLAVAELLANEFGHEESRYKNYFRAGVKFDF